MNVPEQYRLTNHALLGSDSSYGHNGFFIIPHHRINDYCYNCQVSDGEGWEHVSISLTKIVRKTGKAFKRLDGPKGNEGGVHQYRQIISAEESVQRCCTWEEMCYIKNLFWGKDECVLQFHPAEKDYVNMHQFCLHLWKPTHETFPIPDSILVGINSTQTA